MKKLFKLFVLLVIIGILLFPVVLVLSSIEKTPWVERNEKLSFDNVKKVEKLIKAGKPERMRKRQIKEFSITQNDLNILLSYGVSQGLKFENVFLKIELSDNLIKIFFTILLPPNPMEKYANLSVSIKNKGSSFYVDDFQAGKLTLPGFLINPVIRIMDDYVLKFDIYHQLKENARSIKYISITNSRLSIIYDWDPNTLNKLHESGKSFLLSKDHQKRLVLYYNELAEILHPYKNTKISLVGIIRPMFEFAAVQSKLSHLPVLENTALLQVLSLYLTQNDLKNFINADNQKQIRFPARTTITLHGRNDLPKHLLVSAGLTVSAGSSLAGFIGLAKEVDDSAGGSGFSFADLAADKAGVKMGEASIASESQAILFQDRMRSVETEIEFMPEIDHLPEGIMELEFRKKYTDLDSESYAMVTDEINKRIKNCSVYR